MDRKKVAVYARVSTKDQDPEMQLLDLRRYAGERVFEIYREFVDVRISYADELI
jgi:DNA invertase Pin-like site-specific DNA recombinase